MTIEALKKLINATLVGDQLSWKMMVNHVNWAIDEMNSTLNSLFPAVDSGSVSYDYIPDRYIRSVIVPGAVHHYYMVDEEGTLGGTDYLNQFESGLFIMLRDFSHLIPDEYSADSWNGSVESNVGYNTGVTLGAPNRPIQTLNKEGPSNSAQEQEVAQTAAPTTLGGYSTVGCNLKITWSDLTTPYAKAEVLAFVLDPTAVDDMPIGIYYADNNGVLDGYTPILNLPTTANFLEKVNVLGFVDYACIPEGATKVVSVFNGTTLEYPIPATKQRAIEPAKSKTGIIFRPSPGAMFETAIQQMCAAGCTDVVIMGLGGEVVQSSEVAESATPSSTSQYTLLLGEFNDNNTTGMNVYWVTVPQDTTNIGSLPSYIKPGDSINKFTIVSGYYGTDHRRMGWYRGYEFKSILAKGFSHGWYPIIGARTELILPEFPVPRNVGWHDLAGRQYANVAPYTEQSDNRYAGYLTKQFEPWSVANQLWITDTPWSISTREHTLQYLKDIHRGYYDYCGFVDPDQCHIFNINLPRFVDGYWSIREDWGDYKVTFTPVNILSGLRVASMIFSAGWVSYANNNTSPANSTLEDVPVDTDVYPQTGEHNIWFYVNNAGGETLDSINTSQTYATSSSSVYYFIGPLTNTSGSTIAVQFTVSAHQTARAHVVDLNNVETTVTKVNATNSVATEVVYIPHNSTLYFTGGITKYRRTS